MDPHHGSWGFQIQVSVPAGVKRCQLRQFGHPTRASAAGVLTAVQYLLAIAQHADDPAQARLEISGLIREALVARRALPDPGEIKAKVALGRSVSSDMTVEMFLRQWVAGKSDLTPNTHRSYLQQINEYFVPLLGHHRLDRLRAAHVQEALDQIAEQGEMTAQNNAARRSALEESKRAWREHDSAVARAERDRIKQMPGFRRPPGPATIQRFRATLRSALTDACKQQLVVVNVAKLVNLPPERRARPAVWNAGRVSLWKGSGEAPGPSMVWTVEQTRAFLAFAREHRFYPIFMLIAHCGLRRGEAVGLRWQDVDAVSGVIDIRQQIVQRGWQIEVARTKSKAGDRTVFAVPAVLETLKAERAAQQRRRQEMGIAGPETGFVFTTNAGCPLQPGQVSTQFKKLVTQADLPPVRLHSLRHGAATHALSAGVPIKTVSEMLGHSTYQITADTYTNSRELHLTGEKMQVARPGLRLTPTLRRARPRA